MIKTLIGAFVAERLVSTVATAAVEGMSAIYSGKMGLKEQEIELKRQENMVKDKEISLRQMEMACNADPNYYVRMCANSNNYLGMDYRDAIRSLASLGFYNINLRDVFVDIRNCGNRDIAGRVCSLMINGATEFNQYSIFPRDSYVVVGAVVHNVYLHLYMPELEAIRSGIYLNRPVLRCSYCGAKISDEQRFCICCGAPV